VSERGPADRAGIEPGDVILEYNGKTIRNRDDLVSLVTATKPGTAVPVKILRDRRERTLSLTVDELDLEAEANRRAQNNQSNESEGFGITLGNLTPEQARRLSLPRDLEGAVVTDVDPNGAAAQARQPLAAGDVILQVNRQDVHNAVEASRALQAVERGRSAGLLIWRNGLRIFLTIRKQ
jgi:serine protease Do